MEADWEGGTAGGPGERTDGRESGLTEAVSSAEALDGFSTATRAWFEGAFAVPTQAQAQAWRAIGKGEDTLVIAPTGSGKTLAAFLWAIDRLAATPPPADKNRRCRVVYVSPLKALAVDIERNLRSPLTGIGQAARRLGLPEPEIAVAVRTGDTAADERRKIAAHPPDILITTPESLFLLLTSQARDTLRGVETVIVDEVHAVAGTKRGAHLALSLERLDALRGPAGGRAQRVGLSATVRPAAEVATFLGGARPVTVVQPASSKRMELEVIVPVEDLSDLESAAGAGGEDDPVRRRSIWPHVEERVLDLIEAHRSTIVFANSRRLAERLCGRLNELATERAWASAGGEGEGPDAGAFYPNGAGGTWDMAGTRTGTGSAAGVGPDGTVVIARAHHGSVSRVERSEIEEALKAGRLPAVVATSSLELGIDMGAVDLVIQVESPPSVASGLQRVGRAGHNVGDVSRGVIFPKYAGDLIQASVVAERMQERAIEELRIPRNPLDVLAQQIVAMAALDDWAVDELEAMVRRAAPFSGLTRPVLEAVLDMLAGRYPGEEFAGLKPRVVWDRVTGVIHGRPGAQRLAVTSGGTIPDRGYFGVFLASGEVSGRGVADEAGGTATVRGAGARQPKRVGELDEEMVYESRVGDVFVLGASSWRIEDITPDRVLVLPAPGQPGKLPFWHGDTPGGRPSSARRSARRSASWPRSPRPGRWRRCGPAASTSSPPATWSGTWPSSGRRPGTCRTTGRWCWSGSGTNSATGGWCCTPPTATGCTRRGRSPSPRGCASATAGWTCRHCTPTTGSSSGCPTPTSRRRPTSRCSTRTRSARSSPPRSGAARCSRLGSASARPGRCCCPGGSRDGAPRCGSSGSVSAQLLEIASQYPGFPIMLETVRECLQDVFDVPALTEVLRDLAARRIQLVEVETAAPSPFGRSLLFRYVGAFMYEGDAPLAERRAQALALDPALLAELLGTEAMRELLDPAVVAETEADLQHLSAGRRCRDAEAVADLLRTSGPLTAEEVAARCVAASDPRVARLAVVGPADHRGAGGGAADVGGDRGRGAAAGRARRGAAGRHPGGVHRAAARPAGRPGGALGADARAVHRRRGGVAVRARRGRGRDDAAAAVGRRAGGGGRVPHHAARHPVVRRRGAAAAAAAVPGAAAQGGGAGPAGGAGPVPARMARDRASALPPRRVQAAARGRGRGTGGDRAAGGRAGAGVGTGDAGAARPGARLLPRDAGRAHRGGRGGLGGGRHGRQRGRLAGARPRRVRPAAAARAGRADHDAAARRGADGARGRRRPVLPYDRRPGGEGARRPPAR